MMMMIHAHCYHHQYKWEEGFINISNINILTVIIVIILIIVIIVIIIRINGKRATLAERRKVLEESLLVGGCLLTSERSP